MGASYVLLGSGAMRHHKFKSYSDDFVALLDLTLADLPVVSFFVPLDFLSSEEEFSFPEVLFPSSLLLSLPLCLKSVSYHPVPFNLNPTAEINFFKFADPHSLQSFDGPSLIRCIISHLLPHAWH